MDTELESRLESILESRLKVPSRGLTLEKLQGDASYRIYYRITVPPERTFILMKLPEGKSSVSEEITNLESKPTEIPFVNVGRFLRSRGLPVPEIHVVDEASGIVLLEDLGDETLERRVAEAGDNVRRNWYRKAIDLLVSFQTKTGKPDASCIAYARSFDAALFNWEFDHFLEYGVEARLGMKIPEEDAKAIRARTNRIAETLAQEPSVLVHRDFQSRNLMIRNGELHLLDFQDALMGPLPYDLVALLRDSYVSLAPPLFDELIVYYLDRRRRAGTATDAASFRSLFDLITVQRKLKDAGRFVYIDRIKGNPSFLKHIPASLRYVKEAFGRLKDQRELFERLAKFVPEWSPP